MPITIQFLRILEGPNIYYPQGGVAARLAVSADIRDELGHTIKTWAQSVGLIIGYLRMKQHNQPAGSILDISYTCNHPQYGADILRHAVDDLLAAERNDEDWSHDDALFALRRQRMREDPLLPLLQLRAEAQGRGLSVIPVGDGSLQIGTGTTSWRFDPAGLNLGIPIAPPWSEIAHVPLVVVAGGGAAIAAARIAAALPTAQPHVVLVAEGSFDAIRNALLDQSAAVVVAALDVPSAINRGLPFNRCAVGVVLKLAELPEEAALAAGLPALVVEAAGATLLRGDDARSAALARRTAAPVMLLQPGSIPAPAANPLVASVVSAVQSLLDTAMI